jgi:two-component system phosphate regulon sensor histidine kinase PhoR
MRFNIRWKLMGSYLLLTLLLGGVMYAYLTSTLERHLVSDIRGNLLNEARLARLSFVRDGIDLRHDAPALATAAGKEINARITVISPSGEVIGDSEVKTADLPGLDNHLGRPEVQEALKSGAGSSIRYSATLSIPMLYVAVPLAGNNGHAGFIRLALPLTSVEKTRGDLHAILLVSLTLAVFISLVLSYLLSNVTSRSLRSMTEIAHQIGSGAFGKRIPVTTRDELGELAGVMNEMSTRIEEQLERISAEKNRLDTILRGMGEGLMVAGTGGVVALTNPAFRTLFALKDEVEGKPLIDLTRHPALHDGFRKVVASGCEQLEEISLRQPEEKTILTHWVPLVDGGTVQGVVAVFHDISDQKKLEKIRRDFVANVSHELRTPVTIIKGYAETLLAGELTKDPERSSRFVEIIYNHAERLAHLIGDLLTLSEIESGDMAMERAPLSLEGVVRGVMALLEPKAQQKGITVRSSGLERLAPVLADRGRLEQVVVNLLDNALKYTPEGGSVAVTAEEEGDMVRVSVTDSGIGIPDKDLPRIFERFYRVDAARSRDQGGTGLGLSIVKHIVQIHGGTVAVTSTPGKGSTFSFTLLKSRG